MYVLCFKLQFKYVLVPIDIHIYGFRLPANRKEKVIKLMHISDYNNDVHTCKTIKKK